jgi:hypothetical protein
LFRKPGKYVNLKEEWVYEKIMERWGFHFIEHFEEHFISCYCELWVHLLGTWGNIFSFNWFELPIWGRAIMPQATYLKTLKSMLLYNCVFIFYFFFFGFFPLVFFFFFPLNNLDHMLCHAMKKMHFNIWFSHFVSRGQFWFFWDVHASTIEARRLAQIKEPHTYSTFILLVEEVAQYGAQIGESFARCVLKIYVKNVGETSIYRSLVSVSTLTKWIIIFFQKMNSFLNFEIIIFSIIYYNIVMWVVKSFKV